MDGWKLRKMDKVCLADVPAYSTSSEAGNTFFLVATLSREVELFLQFG